MKRTGKYTLKVAPWVARREAPRAAGDKIMDIAERVRRAAIAGGASEYDVAVTMHFLEQYEPLFDDFIQAWSSSGDRAVRQRARAALDQENERKRVPDVERERVRSLDQKLLREYPVRTPRYREIARQLNMKLDRVRYCIEGRRSGRKK